MSGTRGDKVKEASSSLFTDARLSYIFSLPLSSSLAFSIYCTRKQKQEDSCPGSEAPRPDTSIICIPTVKRRKRDRVFTPQTRRVIEALLFPYSSPLLLFIILLLYIPPNPISFLFNNYMCTTLPWIKIRSLCLA